MRWLILNDEEHIKLDSLKHIYLDADIEKVNGRVRLVYHWVFSDSLGEENADKLRFGEFTSKKEAFEWFRKNIEPQLDPEEYYKNTPIDKKEIEDINSFSVYEIEQPQSIVNPNNKKTSELSIDEILSNGDVMDLEMHEHIEKESQK